MTAEIYSVGFVWEKMFIGLLISSHMGLSTQCQNMMIRSMISTGYATCSLLDLIHFWMASFHKALTYLNLVCLKVLEVLRPPQDK